MSKQTLNTIMANAEKLCVKSGGRLTKKRKRILELLLVAESPLSAYEVADAYNRLSETTIPAMSVYRILEFLESASLVHKLSSANKYVACSHISCDHAHEKSQFLICSRCNSVEEVAIPKSVIDALGQQIDQAGYMLLNTPLEIQCVCKHCVSSSAA